MELVRDPIFGEVSLAARHNLDSCKSFSRILPTRVEGASSIVRFVVLAVIKFDDTWLDNQLK
jgi:hypothetical protein